MGSQRLGYDIATEQQTTKWTVWFYGLTCLFYLLEKCLIDFIPCATCYSHPSQAIWDEPWIALFVGNVSFRKTKVCSSSQGLLSSSPATSKCAGATKDTSQVYRWCGENGMRRRGRMRLSLSRPRCLVHRFVTLKRPFTLFTVQIPSL